NRRQGRTNEPAGRLRNGRMSLTEASHTFKRVSKLQDAEVLFGAADDLHANGKSFRRKACRHRGRGIPSGRDIPAGLHPVDVAVELDPRNLPWIRRVDGERRPRGGGRQKSSYFPRKA